MCSQVSVIESVWFATGKKPSCLHQVLNSQARPAKRRACHETGRFKHDLSMESNPRHSARQKETSEHGLVVVADGLAWWRWHLEQGSFRTSQSRKYTVVLTRSETSTRLPTALKA